MDMLWEPILEESSHSKVKDILYRLIERQARQGVLEGTADELSERALLFAYASGPLELENLRDKASAALNCAVEKIYAHQPTALFGGIAGVAWTIQHLSPPENSAQDSLLEIDRFLHQSIASSPLNGSLDLVSGLIGQGIYFLERDHRQNTPLALSLILDRLEARVESAQAGMTWLTTTQSLVPAVRAAFPEGRYDLGIAHGHAGIVRFLSLLVCNNIESARAGILLDGSMKWLLMREQPTHCRSRFSNWLDSSNQTQDSRIAWCYGDLGIAFVIWQVAKLLDRDDWLNKADTILLNCISRGPDGVIDPAFCHGAVGIAHLFNRLYQKNRRVEFKNAASRFYALTIETILSGTQPGSDLLERFIDGNIGIGLALLSAIYPIEPSWDRRLLISAKD